jgi:predicted CoA-binding protein
MTGNSIKRDNFSNETIKEIYNLRNIAIVGISANESKPSHYVPKYLMEKGYNIIPVNPNYKEVFNKKSFGKVSEIPQPVDIVDIFRKSEDVYQVVEDSITKEGIKVIWMQKGIYNKEAEELASSKGIKVIYNRCMLEEHQRLF